MEYILGYDPTSQLYNKEDLATAQKRLDEAGLKYIVQEMRDVNHGLMLTSSGCTMVEGLDRILHFAFFEGEERRKVA